MGAAKFLSLACAFAALTGAPVSADESAVDVELVLAVDVSGSMNGDELRIQREGYVAALKSEEVWRAIEGGRLGRVAILYFEWARGDLHRVLLPWTVIDSAEDARSAAETLAAAPLSNMRNTSISGALRFALSELNANGIDGERRVIDVSGDGPNNQGGAVTDARDAVLDEGITINGLPIAVEEWAAGPLFARNATLADYYEQCVTGGPLSFVIPVTDWNGFPEAVRRKLVLELSGTVPSKPLPVQRASTGQSPDCMIGERLRRQWQDP